jgi:hypothetical protein
MRKPFSIVAISITIIMLTINLQGCASMKRALSSSDSGGSITSTEPLTGSWSMTRINIEPEVPSQVPSFVVDQVIPKNTTWNITSSNGKLKLDYGGKSSWYNPLGIPVNLNTATSSESADKKSCTFNGGGNINASKLPGVLSFIGSIQNIAINYTDKINVVLSSQNQISATVTYSASGKYDSSKGTESINYQGKIVYSGNRK